MEAGALVCDAVGGSWQVKQATILLLVSGRLMIRSVTEFAYSGRVIQGQRYLGSSG